MLEMKYITMVLNIIQLQVLYEDVFFVRKFATIDVECVA